MAMRAETIALSLLTAVEGAHFFSARLPSKMTIHKFVHDPDAVRAIKEGIVESCFLSMALSAIVSWLTRSTLPLVVGGAATAVMAWLYLRDLKTRPDEGLDITNQ